jgi:hypothetical protein
MGKASGMGNLGLWMGLRILLVGTHANGRRDPAVDQSCPLIQVDKATKATIVTYS